MRALLPSLLCGLLIAGCVPKPEKNYTPDEIPQITSIEEVMRVQAARMDPLFGIRDQASFTDEEFARMAKAAAVLEATSAHLAESFAGKGEYDAGFAELANQLGAGAKALREATESNEAAGARAALESMRDTCKACHAAYR